MSPILYPEEIYPAPTSKSPIDPSCTTKITLSCIMRLYNAVGYKPHATRKNTIGITGFLEQYANQRDLASFYRQQLPEAVYSSFKSVSVYGAFWGFLLFSIDGSQAGKTTRHYRLQAKRPISTLNSDSAFPIRLLEFSGQPLAAHRSIPMVGLSSVGSCLLSNQNVLRSSKIRMSHGLMFVSLRVTFELTILSPFTVARLHPQLKAYTANNIHVVRRRRADR